MAIDCLKGCDYLKELTFPSSLTSFTSEWCRWCPNVTKLKLPDEIEEFEHTAFKYLPKLHKLKISSKWKLEGDQLYRVIDGVLHSIELPSKIKQINKNDDITWERSTSLTIPSNVTRLADYCFSNSIALNQLNGLHNVSIFGKGCFFKMSTIITR